MTSELRSFSASMSDVCSFLARLIVVAGLTFLTVASVGSVSAQEPSEEVVPQIITYVSTEPCGDEAMPFTLEIWNVGSEAGESYSQAVLSGYDCINGEISDEMKSYPIGTFSGGPVVSSPLTTLRFRFNCSWWMEPSSPTVQLGWCRIPKPSKGGPSAWVAAAPM